ncbi:MAG TPA: universal stress protein [Streptosporangiaceae bacterium]|jgi:nucleotide-binding universal stress UspA family protein|nr:universal stress protein [Streptosporangiaceae bacterium]
MTGTPGGGQGRGEQVTHPILAGYDGSASSRHALAYAAGMARRHDGYLIVVHVTTSQIAAVAGYSLMPIAAGCANRDDQLYWLFRELADAADITGLSVEVVEREGDPARELANMAVEKIADAIVIGAPEQLMHRFAGSVPAWLVRHACCPVVIVP